MVYGLLSPSFLLAQQRSLKETELIARMAFAETDSASILLQTRSSSLFPRIDKKREQESFYIYSDSKRGNNFVIVSGDEKMPKILAYSYSEPFDTDNIPDNVRYWLSCYDEESFSKSTNIHHTSYVENTQAEGVSPILGNLKWGQGAPFNLQCPLWNGVRCVTGCVATAMAMVMKYYQYPDCGKGSVSYTTDTHHINVTRDFATHPLQWNEMLEQYDNTTSTTQQRNAVANLMANCGAVVKMDYDPDGSGAYQYDMLTGYVKNFSYDDDAAFIIRDFFPTETWHWLLVNELNEGRPVNYAGSNSSDGGHSFIIDGYQMSNDETKPYYHLNWGWNGRCDGYYLLSDLHPREEEREYTSRAFSEGQQMLIGVKPEDGIAHEERVLCTDNASVSLRKAVAGGQFTVTLASIYNLSYKSFSGDIVISLEAEKGDQEWDVGRKKIGELTFLKGTNRFTIECNLPSEIEEGKYNVVIKAENKVGFSFRVNMPEDVNIIIGDSPIDNDDLENSVICTSEIEVYKQPTDETKINMRVYEVFNYNDDTFTGWLQPVLTDRKENPIVFFSDSILLSEMLSKDFLNEPIEFHFHVTSDLPDGSYRLYLFAKPIEKNNLYDVRYYNMAETDFPHKYYLDVIIINKEVRIGNVCFQRIPTSIMMANTQHNIDTSQMYSIWGQKVKQAKKGIYIIRESDGFFKKVLIK